MDMDICHGKNMEKWKSSVKKTYQSNFTLHKTFDTLASTSKCHEVHACQARLQPLLKPEKSTGSAFPYRHGHTTTEQDNLNATCVEAQNRHFVRDILQLSHVVEKNNAFLRMFSRIPRYYLKIDVLCEASVNFQDMSHACLHISTLTQLDPALPIRFAKTRQHHTSKVLHLLWHIIFWTPFKNIAPVKPNHFHKHDDTPTVQLCSNGPHCEWWQTFANGWEGKKQPQANTPPPPHPQNQEEPFDTHSGKNA
jgi:hypothetical protein